jgi:hypothetical protein
VGIGAPWYPDAQPDELRRAAQAYRELATAIGEAAQSASPAMRAFFAANTSDMLVPYREAWTALADSGSCPSGYMGELANGCGQMAAGLEEAAAGIDELRGKIDDMVAGGAVVTVAAGILTFGVGSAVAGAATAGTVATTTALVISTFLTRVAIVAAFEFVGGYLTDLALQTMAEKIFDPGRPIDLDHGHALQMGGLSAAIGGPLYAAPGVYRFASNSRYVSGLSTWRQMSFFGRVGEASMLRLTDDLGESVITQRQFTRLDGTRPSTADGIVSNPGPGLRGLYADPGRPWDLALLEAKATGRPVDAMSLLSANQRATLVRLAVDGGQTSVPLAALLGRTSTTVAPGTTSNLLVVISGQGDILLRMPVALRRLVTTHGWDAVLSGAAGPAGQRLANRFLSDLPVRVVEVP